MAPERSKPGQPLLHVTAWTLALRKLESQTSLGEEAERKTKGGQQRAFTQTDAGCIAV